MKIKWKRIAEYPNYAVSTDGQICNIRTKKLLKLQQNHKQPNAAITIKLYNDGYYRRLNFSRLVAQAFLDNPYGKRYVCHRDGHSENNKVTNLFWHDHNSYQH